MRLYRQISSASVGSASRAEKRSMADRRASRSHGGPGSEALASAVNVLDVGMGSDPRKRGRVRPPTAMLPPSLPQGSKREAALRAGADPPADPNRPRLGVDLDAAG